MIALAVISCILGSVGAIAFLGGVVFKDSYFGCLITLLFLLLLGGYIGGNVAIGLEYGAPGVAIANIVGIILGIIAIFVMKGNSSNSSSPSSSSKRPLTDEERLEQEKREQEWKEKQEHERQTMNEYDVVYVPLHGVNAIQHDYVRANNESEAKGKVINDHSYEKIKILEVKLYKLAGR